MMSGSGLAGAMGGAHLKLLSDEPQEVLLPLPQLADGQVPLCYFISSSPPEVACAFRLRKRDDSNVIVSVRLTGKNQEVELAWSSVVLLAGRNVSSNTTPPEPYRNATSCVQSDADEITQIAKDLWPDSGKAGDFAARIQQHIGAMKRTEQPRSLDALGILKSGEGSICTANANLASALMRSRGIGCRSIAVIPPISQRLEMHRIVEFYDKDQWHAFDPSSVQVEIPAKPWQNIIMAKTTIADEQMAMTERRAAMPGCPYGQEAELLSSSVTLYGQDFFWTLAKPLAEFELTEEGIRLATAAWMRYLQTGTLTQGQIKAGSAKSASDLVESLHAK